MAGIGVELNRIYEKNTIGAYIWGFSYSVVITVAPMLLVIGNILLMGYVLDLSKQGYADRTLLSCTVMYMILFPYLVTSIYNGVLSKYIADSINDGAYGNILASYYLGLLINVATGCVLSVPFCIREHIVGGVEVYYVFTGFFGYTAMVLVFYGMKYLSIFKDYKLIALYYLIGMAVSFFLAFLLVKVCGWEVPYSILLALVAGFMLIACMEYAMIRQYFTENSRDYRGVLSYFPRYWKQMLANFLYALGLYVHNFVFWTTDISMVVADSFVCSQPYDLAASISLFNNTAATIGFIAWLEMDFHVRYKEYLDAVTGGRGRDIRKTKTRMFSLMSAELMSMTRKQFIISTILFLAFMFFLPRLGFSGLVLEIYPCLSVGFFILFIMYSAMFFLDYFNDLSGLLMASAVFCIGTLAGSILSSRLPVMLYGLGMVIGSFAGWTTTYFRLRYMERHMDVHLFCKGSIVRQVAGKMPPRKVYDAGDRKRAG